MVDDIDLPVWTIRPNWKNGILERLSWLTDVLPSTYGVEQRRALRLSPRRTFEMLFNPVDRVRTFFDLWLHRMGSQEFMLPLFHDKGRLSQAVVFGEEVIPVDTAYREFEAGGLAIIMGEDPFVYDKLEIISVEADSITVAEPGVLNGSGWPEGSAVYPLRRSRLAQDSKLTGITSRVGSATLAFELNQANDIADEGAWDTLYGGVPVLLNKPNWRDQIDLDFIRNSLLLDNEHGLRTLADEADRAFTLQVHGNMMRGRAEHWAFRQFLYRLRGQQGAILVPTFNRDLELSQDRLAADTYIRIKQIGYAYTGGLVSGRHLLLLGDDTIREVSGVPAAPSATEERLDLTAALGVNMPAGTFGSFIEPCRLSSDDIEIVHHTDTDGVAECNLSFRAFRDERTTDGPLDTPIPLANQRSVPCGEEEPSGDAAIAIVIDRSSVMNTAGRMAWARNSVAGFLEGIRPLIAGGSVIDIQCRTMYSTSSSLTKRAATEADLDALIAWVLGIGTGSTIIGDWRPASNGVKGYFDATDPELPRRLYWVGRGRAAWDFMGTGGAATLNSIAPKPMSAFFIYAGGGNTHALLVDDTPVDGIPEFDPSEVAETTAAMLAI